MNRRRIDLARNGDPRARALLVRDMQDAWYRLALHMLSDPDLAADAAQETALRFLRQLPWFAARSRLRTWAFGIALNVCREMARRWPCRALSDAAALADASAGPACAAEADDDRRRLRRGLAAVPLRQREAIVLRFFEGLSIREAATAMNCAPGTVKAAVFQALRSLRRTFGDGAPPPAELHHERCHR